MLELLELYNSVAEIPEWARECYVETDGKWKLDIAKVKIPGMSAGDGGSATLKRALDAERKLKKEVESKLTAANTAASTLESTIEELRAEIEAGGGKPDEAKIGKLVADRVKAATAKHDLAMRELAKKHEESEAAVAALRGEARQSKLVSEVTRACSDAAVGKLLPTSMHDILEIAPGHLEVNEEGEVVTKERGGVPAGLPPVEWLKQMKPQRPHWWGMSAGGGAAGGAGGAAGGDNPWSKGNWNMQKQGEFLRQHGVEKATSMAKSAGTSLGGPIPAK